MSPGDVAAPPGLVTTRWEGGNMDNAIQGANALRPPLNEDQLSLVRTVFDIALRLPMQWPTWDYVERTLYRERDLDARVVFSSLPRLVVPDSTASYGLVWAGTPTTLGELPAQLARADLRAIPPNAWVGLTVAGLRHLPAGIGLLRAYFWTLSLLVAHERAITPLPDQVVGERVFLDELFKEVAPTDPWTRDHLPHVLGNEPATWGDITLIGPRWAIQLRPTLRRYRDLRGADNHLQAVDDYLDRIAASFVRPTPPSQPALSPHSLPDAIGYLDVVWQVRTTDHLLGHVGPGALTRLGQDCDSPAEFNSSTSALGEVFSSFQVPEVPDLKKQPGTLERLRRHLIAELPDESHGPIEQAIGVLRAAQRIRTGGQHSGAAAEATKKFGLLGISYPPSDWGLAWTIVRSKVIAALDGIREELQANPR
jgi:hypothetical protein